MRTCPSCNESTETECIPDGRVFPFCPRCGWGADRIADARAGRDDAQRQRGPGPLALVGLWLATVLVAVGPYVLIRYVDPTILAEHLPHYVGAMVGYFVIANTITPRYDPNDLGWGGTRFDNPFSLSDDYNRGMESLALFLFPGTAAGAALVGTWRLLRGR